ncbi:MAG: iron-containing alcohol dehydrogenase [Coprobacillus sp.]|nr:iron-containing alcohol dehydrogenase [Coprobacillus sp.]
MQYDFNFSSPTKIYFGKTALNNLKGELDKYGKNILLIYGGGSIKKIGLYDKIIKILKEANKEVYELSGVTPNPQYKKMMEGVQIARKTPIDLILAVGGGSVIDLAKGVAASIYCFDEDPYQKYWLEKKPLDNKVVPIGAILTMAGTGSEANGGSVMSNDDLKLKVGRVFPEEVYPKFAILNPEYTYSVPQYQMRAGSFDIMSHLMEQYFSDFDDNVSDYLNEALMKCVINSLKKANINPTDYEARSNLMWSATLALNHNLVNLSKTEDWEVHAIEHQISAFTDCTHGMGLAAISVPYYKLIYKDGLAKFKRFALNVWGIEDKGSDQEIALKGLDALKEFIRDEIGVLSIKDLGVTGTQMISDIADSVELGGGYKILTRDDVYQVLLDSYKLNY